jgi:hypothetical protein
VRSPISETRISEVRKRSFSTSRVAKPGENHSRPSEQERWQRSRDLANSEVRRVRAQRLSTPSDPKIEG